MIEIYSSYYKIVFFDLVLSILLSFVVFLISFLLIGNEFSKEKQGSYECGFESFNDARERFDIKFYLVGVLFIIFDLEIVYILPVVIKLHELGIIGLLSFGFFFSFVTIGFIYEWKEQALEWPYKKFNKKQNDIR